MRNYLFRGKTISGKWVYGSLIVAGDYCCILEPEDAVHPMNYPYLDKDLGTIDGEATPVIPETVGQWTGMKDKHGRMIFEGDILHCITFGFDKDEFTTVVKFGPRSGVQGFYLANGRNMFYFGQTDLTLFDDGSVIGNIHDNPELIDNN